MISTLLLALALQSAPMPKGTALPPPEADLAPEAFDPRPKLTIGDRDPVIVANRADIERVLAACTSGAGCESIWIESCDRCMITAARSAKGYWIEVRHGPPADMSAAVRATDKTVLALAKKDFDPERDASDFTFAEVIDILAGYVDDGREDPRFVWKAVPSPLDDGE